MNRVAPLAEAEIRLLRATGEKRPEPVPEPRPIVVSRARRSRRYPLRGRHIRERGRLRAPVPLSVTHVDDLEERLVLGVLRRRAGVDLDAAQVGAAAALPPSLAAMALDRLVRAGLVTGSVVHGRQRFELP